MVDLLTDFHILLESLTSLADDGCFRRVEHQHHSARILRRYLNILKLNTYKKHQCYLRRSRDLTSAVTDSCFSVSFSFLRAGVLLLGVLGGMALSNSTSLGYHGKVGVAFRSAGSAVHAHAAWIV